MLARTQERSFGLSAEDFNTYRVWHILTIDPLIPEQVARRLERAKLRVYWPNFIVQLRYRAGMRRPRRRAVLHGYMLIVFPAQRDDFWDVVHDTEGVNGYLRDELGYPKLVDERHIDIIREIEGRLNVAPTVAPEITFSVGDLVRIIVEKKWVDWTGTVFAIADFTRIGVEVSLLGRTVPVWVAADQIEAI